MKMDADPPSGQTAFPFSLSDVHTGGSDNIMLFGFEKKSTGVEYKTHLGMSKSNPALQEICQVFVSLLLLDFQNIAEHVLHAIQNRSKMYTSVNRIHVMMVLL
jgi:hypothetical protein